MAGPLIFLTLTEKPPIEARMRAHPAALQNAYLAAGGFWAQEILSIHFTPQAARLYGYKKRTQKTLKRKLAAARVGAAIMGGRVDNVFTGLMMRAVLGHQRIEARANAVQIYIFGPKYLYQYDKRKNQPDKAAEISAVNRDDLRGVEAKLDETYHDEVNAVDETKTTRFGGMAA